MKSFIILGIFKGCRFIYIYILIRIIFSVNFILSTSICIIIGTEVLFCQNKFNYRFNDFVYDLCIGGINISVTRVATNYVNFLWNFSTVEHVVPRSPSPIISTRTFNREIRIKLRLQCECFFFS